MDNFPKTLAEAKLCLAKAKPWALVAAITALVVVGFYSLEGWRFWQAWDQSRVMTGQIEKINAKLNREPPTVEISDGQLDLRQQRLEYFENMFNQADLSQPGVVDLSSVSLESDARLQFLQPDQVLLATITFTAIGPGTSALELGQTQPVDPVDDLRERAGDGLESNRWD